ncbi:RNA recognition motif domain containing protein [Entamoeba histolytica]|uniref:RNA recognition motif domain containing protein n=1 Tax=Entamoeba histolytica TaxID=5759 RepID=A0A175JL21_ENTHI|nr:RNA recognition motif domain containing protein [Entamoeba histolytica]
MPNPTVFIAFQQPIKKAIVCNDLYDSVIRFGKIQRIICMNSHRPDMPHSLIEFESPESSNKCIEYLKTNPLPILNYKCRAEVSNAESLNVKTESPQAHDYTISPRFGHEAPITRVLLVNELPRYVTPQSPFHFYNLFSLYGSIIKVNVLSEKRTAMIEYSSIEDTINAYQNLSNVKFFGSRLIVKHSKHDSVAAPPGIWCKYFQPSKLLLHSTAPSVFVKFIQLHPIIACSPNTPMALCHYFDHYFVPRPVDVFFDSPTSGVFAFKTTQDAVICVSILNNKNENGILLKLAFVSEPPQVSPSNIKYGYSQPHPMSRMSANQPILPAQPITPFQPMLLPQTIPSQNLPPQSLPPQNLPPQSLPPQSLPPQSLPPQSLPPQSLPPQSLPPQSLPPQSLPPQSLPPQSLPPQSLPPQSLPPQSLPPQSLPPQSLPPQSLPPQSLPPQSLPPQSLPPQSLPPQNIPSQNIPSQSVSSQSLPSQSLPPQNLPFQQSQLTNPYSSYKLESQNNNQPYSLNETETTKPIKPPTHYYNYSQ